MSSHFNFPTYMYYKPVTATTAPTLAVPTHWLHWTLVRDGVTVHSRGETPCAGEREGRTKYEALLTTYEGRGYNVIHLTDVSACAVAPGVTVAVVLEQVTL